MNGNNVAVEIENYGGIAPGLNGIREITNLIWRDAPYIFQFCPVVGASVVDTSGNRVHIITDAMNDYELDGLREFDPATGLKWQWQPLPGYADPNQSILHPILHLILIVMENRIAGLEIGIMKHWDNMFGLDIWFREKTTQILKLSLQWMTEIIKNLNTFHLLMIQLDRD